jgi:hypothetical protein
MKKRKSASPKAIRRAMRAAATEEMEANERFWRNRPRQAWELVGYGNPINTQSARITNTGRRKR